ncbi:MAG: hypothetical protein RR835_02225 [Peptostreptococcaceae bacterium]
MELKVRYLKADIVNKIDNLYKQEGYKSRNEFLVKKIEEIAYENEAIQLETDYENLMNSLIEATKNTTQVLSSFIDHYVIDVEEAYSLNINNTNIKNSIQSKATDLNVKEDTSRLSIKKVPVNLINRIDEICKERDITRDDFLVKYLNQLTYSSSLKLVNEKYEYMAEKVLGVLDFSNRILSLFYEENCIDTSSFYEGEEV